MTRQILLHTLILLSLLAYGSVVVLSTHVQLVGTKVRGMSVSWAWQADCPMGHGNRVVTPKGALVFPICICEKCGILWRPPGSPVDLYEKEGARCR